MPEDSTLYSKSNVSYRKASGEDDGPCISCKWFIPGKNVNRNGKCVLVKGLIAPDYTCNLWSLGED